MKVLTVFAHPASKSFCHAVLDRFDAGLRDAGHTNEIVDLYAIGFDPILRPRDTPSWLTETIPDDMLDRMRLRESLLDEAGGPLKRFALKRLIGDRDARGIIRLLRERYQPKDVLVQQQKVARAEALAFVAPVHFLSFPAILKGWLDRVWTPGFAYDLTAGGLARRHQRPSAEAHAQEGADHPDDDLRQARLRRGPPRRHAHGD